MHEIHVTIVSPEEASYGTAEFWSGGRMIGFTRLEDGDLMFRIEPRGDGAAVVVGAHSLAAAIAEAPSDTRRVTARPRLTPRRLRMSPRLLYQLTTLRTPFPLERERDRVDARCAATRMLTHVGVLP